MKVKRRIEYIKTSKNLFLSIILSLIFLISFLLFLFVPKIYLVGSSVVSVNINSKYEDMGIKTNFFNKEEEKKVKVISNVDTSKMGTYEVKYLYKNNLFTYKLKRTVIVKDMVKPVIVLEGEKKEYYCPNGEYKELGFKAYDNVDNNITDKVKVKQEKDRVIYRVEDSSGNKSKVVRKIIAKDKISPTITLNGEENIFLGLNESYVEEDVVVNDNCDLDLEVETTNNIDNTKIGDYNVTYKVKDKSNNEAIITRNVRVREPLNANTIYLTFDDGPRDGTTDVILDILKEKGVKATFFVTTNGSDSLIKRIVDEGHSIGIHTSSHRYDIIYASVDNYFNDLDAVKNRIYNITGIDTKLIRFPGGSSNTVSKKYSEGIMSTLTRDVLNKGYQYYDWNIDSGDASFATSPSKLYNSVVNSISHDKYNVILLHDTKTYTRDALSKIIDYCLNNGYRFDTLDINKMPLRQKVNN